MNTLILLVAGIGVALAGYFVLRRFESMKRKSSDELRAMLRSPDWLFYRNALSELRRRREDIRGEVAPILNLLISDAKAQRIAGWLTLRELYPDLAERVPDYRPEESPDACKDKLEKIFHR